MPRRALNLLKWSQQSQSYELSSSKASAIHEIIPESQAWREWLDTISSFAFHSRCGMRYTVRKEAVQQNGSYWYGYRSWQGRTSKRYLGRTSDLTLARLEEIANNFTAEAASRAGQSLSSTEPLLISRLHPPRLPLGLIERTHLFARLAAWRTYKLTLLRAPAGFGKTTLANSWLAQQQKQQAISHLAWISLQASDNDQLHFWRTIISAYQSWQGEPGKTALTRLASAFRPPFAAVPLETILALFLNDLAKQAGNSILVLDDYHLITEPRLHEALSFFIEHLPLQVHVVILTRNEPNLPLTRWRAQGYLQELSSQDLRFSTIETATFLELTVAASLSAAQLAQLDALLQGWAAGLRLLILAGKMEQAGIERLLSGLEQQQPSNSFRQQLLDYFISEVLDAQPEALQRFLLQTSVLGRLTGSLCDTIMDGQNSSEVLETLELSGLFLEALDEAVRAQTSTILPWYRYHALFAEAMRAEAQRRFGEERLRTIARQASYWYEQHELADAAIEAALQAHDMERAALLIERFSSGAQQIELHILQSWLAQMPEATIDAHPTLCLYAAITLQFQAEPAHPSHSNRTRISALLQKAEEGWRSSGQLTEVGVVFAFRALIASLRETAEQEAVENASKALNLFAVEPGENHIRPTTWQWRTICLGIVGTTAMHQGRFEESQQLLLEALADCQTDGNQEFLREICLRLGTLYQILGKLYQAYEYFQRTLSLGLSQRDYTDCQRALRGLAQLSLEWNDLDAVEQRIHEALELMEQNNQERREDIDYLLALLSFAHGQNISAQLRVSALLARLQTTLIPAVQELLTEVLSLQTRLQLDAHDYLAAQNSLHLLSSSAHELSFGQQMVLHILQVRLLLAQGMEKEAIALLAQLLPVTQEKQYMRGQLELLILLALAHATCKQKAEAHKWLYKALSLAYSEGFLRVFLQEGDAMAHLLRSLLPAIREKTVRAYGQAILRALLSTDAASTPPVSLNDNLPFEPLSGQEQRVLRLLLAGYSNLEIAAELIISVNTVKDHLKHLYRKLGVSNRREVRKAARNLKLS
ncbi:hypothetical protein EPA93_17725 [Ktedonosporobacter rubrisoli]|uniref:HTH luxR-type domain-containing protein n=1 Tax=Ktedonosporobacter rubrisoli TaxID=2509675 RepID=A0A4V0YYX4_KTERU|nr:LuxR C-terminal-related transcriptional regulator [Ktedonosporobacter rubrisoli]QBD77731.1 hypothetical protein EPA93_17725 [Ktedonosporobacter rubrisoli]